MSQVEDFLTAEQEQLLIEAIKISEKNTSGEIRVHIEENTEKLPLERALEVFHFLKMDTTKLRNGILLYIAVESRKFVILGDEGINNKVPKDFWETEKEFVLSHFAKGEFEKGIDVDAMSNKSWINLNCYSLVVKI